MSFKYKILRFKVKFSGFWMCSMEVTLIVVLPRVRAPCWLVSEPWSLISDLEFPHTGKVRFFSQFCFLEFCQTVHQTCSSSVSFFRLLGKGSCSQLYNSLLESHDQYSIVTLYFLDTKESEGGCFVLLVRRRIGNEGFLVSPAEMVTWSCLPLCLLSLSVCLASTLYAFGRGTKP